MFDDVLAGAEMPAIQLEGAFLTQPDEAALSRASRLRDALAEGLARGIARDLSES
jgi:N-acetylmuramoyl-L-alanine amidase